MKKTGILVSLAGALALFTTLPSLAAGLPPVARVIVIQTNDVSAYLHEVTALQELFKKAGSPLNLRVWRATFAGNEAGTIIVDIEYPNFAALAKGYELQRTNPDIVAAMKKIGGMRKIVSDNLYEQITE